VMSLADYLLHGYEQALPDDGRRTGLA
jgi:hypothetical protein